VGFRTYMLYVFMVFMRPFEQFAPELMELRPVLILWVLMFLSTMSDASKVKWGAGEGRLYWMLAGMAGTVLMSTALNGGFAALGDGVGDFSTPAMLFAMTCMNVVSIQRYRKLALLFMFCVVALCLESLYAYHTGWRASDLVIPQLARENILVPKDLPAAPADDTSGSLIWRIRSVGFLSDPNDFAQTIIVVAPWLLMLGDLTKPLWRRALLLMPVFAILGYTLSLTHSRGGMLGTVAAVVFILKSQMSRGNFTRMMLAGGILGAAVMMGGGGGDRAISSKEQSASERIDAWNDGLLMLKSNPLVGVGYGNFTEHHNRTAHNSFVLCFAETGLLGYFLWLGMIVLSIKSLNRVIECAQARSEPWLYAVLLRASLVGFLVCSWFLSRTFEPTLYILMAMAACLLYLVRQSIPAKVQPRLHEPVNWAWTTVQFIGLTMVMVSVFIRSAKM
jgi:putative inorganic carbon (HCO3(-)) transporter